MKKTNLGKNSKNVSSNIYDIQRVNSDILMRKAEMWFKVSITTAIIAIISIIIAIINLIL